MNTFDKQRIRENKIQKMRKQAEEAPNKEIYPEYREIGASDKVETIFEN